MAALNPTARQRQTTFEIIEPLFYPEFNGCYPIFPEWTLERMPRSVNTRRIILNEYKMLGDWLYESYNTKGKFRCIKCIKNGARESEATWSSSYTTVLFRAYYGPDTDEFGQTWIGGWIQMKFFAQQCGRCWEYITAELDNDRPGCLVKWLHRWIANKFYGYYFARHGYRGRQMTLAKHRQNLCEACHAGWCYYLTVHEKRRSIATETE